MEILVSTLLRSAVAATLWFILRVLTPGEPSRTAQRMARSVVDADSLRRMWDEDLRRAVEARARRRRARLANPNFRGIEVLHGSPASWGLRGLYADPAEIAQEDFIILAPGVGGREVLWHVSHYCPIDWDGLMAWHNEVPPKLSRFVRFAVSGGGLAYVMDPRHSNPPVWLFNPDTHSMTLVCVRFTDFAQFSRWKCTPPDPVESDGALNPALAVA
jgi:hypothetical protein